MTTLDELKAEMLSTNNYGTDELYQFLNDADIVFDEELYHAVPPSYLGYCSYYAYKTVVKINLDGKDRYFQYERASINPPYSLFEFEENSVKEVFKKEVISYIYE